MLVKTVCAVCALALGSAVLAASNDQLTVTGQPIAQERVSFSDLDLRNSADQRQLRKRVWAASDRVCVAAEGPRYKDDINAPVGYSPDAGMNCADISYRDARPQIIAAIAAARAGTAMAVSRFTVTVRTR